MYTQAAFTNQLRALTFTEELYGTSVGHNRRNSLQTEINTVRSLALHPLNRQ